MGRVAFIFVGVKDDRGSPSAGTAMLSEGRAPPQARLFNRLHENFIPVAAPSEQLRAFYWLEAENWVEIKKRREPRSGRTAKWAGFWRGGG
jgi:hypothetical protein